MDSLVDAQRIFIVEDDPAIGQAMVGILSTRGFAPTLAKDFSQIDQEFMDIDPHLVILDVNLPKFDGFHWCRTLRSEAQVPILFVSARDSDMDVIMGIGAGGDDYLTKPFSLEVLLAKIQALLRRAYLYKDTGNSRLLEYRGLALDPGKHQLHTGKTTIELTRHEYSILHALLEVRGQVVSRETLMAVLWHGEVFVDDNTLTVNINRLRKRLSDVGFPDIIVTRKQQGYQIP
jgi:DNA-binding response OmpR family regulator